MAYSANSKSETKKGDAASSGQEGDRIAQYQSEFNKWLTVLQRYHTTRFDKNYRQYTAYAATQGTHTKISDPVAPEIVERVVQKMFNRDPKFFVMSRGRNIPSEITRVMEGVAEYLWTNPDVVQATGSMRSKLKMAGREFGVLGNTGVETYYNVEADSSDFRIIPLEDIIFDPTKSLKRSTRYYIRQYVSVEYLKEQREIKEDGKVVRGIFKNMDKVEKLAKKGGALPNDPTTNKINRYGSSQYDDPVDKLLLVSCWDGKKLCQIIEWQVVVREVEDPMQLDDDPLDFAMDIEVPKIPYAFSMLDFINGLTTAKDLILNQVVDYGAKALNPPLFVDPSVSPLNRQTLRNAYRTGGIVMVTPQQAGHLEMPPLPAAGFDLMNYIQQRSESVTGIGAYLGGVPNQVSDKTKGTKGGVEALIAQGASPVQDRQQNIEESLIEPIINKMLKMTGALMGRNERKWIFITGQNKRWIQVTRGLLTGKIALPDLVASGLISEEDAATTTSLIQKEEKDNDPETRVLFEVEWIIRVETGSMAETDTQKDIESLNNWVGFNAQFGVPMDLVAISKELAMRSGIKEPDQYLAVQGAQGGPPGQQGGQPGQEQSQEGGPAIVNKEPFTPGKSGSQGGGVSPVVQQQQHSQRLDQQKQGLEAQLAQNEQHHQQNLQMKQMELDSKMKIEQMKASNTPQPVGEAPVSPAQNLIESMAYKDLPVEAQNAILKIIGLPATAKPPLPPATARPTPAKAATS